ncbi:MAG TPA: ROK family transcriptional regulator [Trueperaceae bacterium]|nr:ROK family transcriptional regulator [Trueperaceae bacterium]
MSRSSAAGASGYSHGKPANNAGSRDAMRAQNQRDVFQEVHRRGPISRADIATALHLSPATVTNITAELIARGLLFEAREAVATGVGRRAILLEIDYDGARVAGVKLSNVGITCAVTNLNAEVQETASAPLDDTEPESVVAAIAALLAKLDHTNIVALGLNLPGIVSEDGVTVRHSPLLGWEQVAIGRMLHSRLGIPVVVENDVNALALAEAWFGYGRGHDSFLAVTLGRGLGLGIILGGEIYRGPRGGAGEFGHVLIDPHGPETKHARRGTLEAYLSDEALVRNAHDAGVAPSAAATADELTALALAGDPAAQRVLEQAGEVLGRALAILVNIFAPSLIILSGEGMRAAELLVGPATTSLENAAFADLGSQVQLIVDTWGDDAWARGAAALAASRYLIESASRTGGEQATI